MAILELLDKGLGTGGSFRRADAANIRHQARWELGHAVIYEPEDDAGPPASRGPVRGFDTHGSSDFPNKRLPLTNGFYVSRDF